MALPTAAIEIISLLGLEPLPLEGGHYRETWRGGQIPGGRPGRRHGSAIYYLITRDGFSAMHRLPTDEVFHFYQGDPVEQLLLLPDGSSRLQVLGNRLRAGERPQLPVPAGAWQGSRLAPGGSLGYALVGTTMAPGYHPDDYEHGVRASLIECFPERQDLIVSLTRTAGDDRS